MKKQTAENSKSEELARAEKAAKYIFSKTKLRPKLALVLGSGLGVFADELSSATRIPYDKIPGFPPSTVEGHAGTLVIGHIEGPIEGPSGGRTGKIPVAVMQGRVHFYEGYAMKDVVFPMRVFGRLGIQAAILTNAAGAINLAYDQGALVVIRDHINLMGINPLIGPNEPAFGPRFPDMTNAYWPAYRQIAREEAEKLGIPPHEGVYAAFTGPSYETPAEIRFMRGIGADLVGMSTIPEVIVARHMGIRILGISCVTNMAAGILDREIDHAEVMATGLRVRAQFVALLRALIPRLHENVSGKTS